ncbi:hypothetical protein QAD02_021624 [Eretmocerus hayati]|uniref:Uncharacterized protein n=1 Tax=Eretmocerus hayati TaxID=131215 RepID=A0ACC2PS90_9HYME|nr:hypothetical protein QAD02_021624 [Eretmocerus hayati]
MAEEVGIATLDLTETQEMGVDEFFEEDVSDDDDEEYLPAGEGKAPELFDQEELNDVVRKLGLPKNGAEYSASLLKKKNLSTKGTKDSDKFGRNRSDNAFFTGYIVSMFSY